MGCDVAVGLLDIKLDSDSIGSVLVREALAAQTAYLVTGIPRSEWGPSFFFALWSDEPVDIETLCRDISATYSTTVLLAWKSEHGGVAGYVIYENGEAKESIAESDDEYLFAASRGLEAAFGTRFALSNEERLCFPELLFDGRESCHLIEIPSGKLTSQEPDTTTRLLEDDLGVEPVLPFEF